MNRRKTVYKVCMVCNGKYYSFNALPKKEILKSGLSLEYPIKCRVEPRVKSSRLFAFDDLHAATNFGVCWAKHTVVLEGVGENVKPIKLEYIPLLDDDAELDKAWNDGEFNIGYSGCDLYGLFTPKGSVLCTAFTPHRVIARFNEERVLNFYI